MKIFFVRMKKFLQSSLLVVLVFVTSQIHAGVYDLRFDVQSIGGIRFSDSQNLEMLNLCLVESPSTVLRIGLARQAIYNFFKSFAQQKHLLVDQSADQLFAQGELKKIIAPVQQFFSALMTYLTILKPLVEECDAHHGLTFRSSFFDRFFRSGMSIEVFCKNFIDSSDALAVAGYEILCFFADLEASMSDLAKQKSQELLQQLQNKKKKNS